MKREDITQVVPLYQPEGAQVSDRSIDRYLRDKKQDQLIKAAARKSLEYRANLCRTVKGSRNPHADELDAQCAAAVYSNDEELQCSVFIEVVFENLTIERRREFIIAGLCSAHHKVQRAAAKMLKRNSNYKDLAAIVLQGLQSADITVQAETLFATEYFSGSSTRESKNIVSTSIWRELNNPRGTQVELALRMVKFAASPGAVIERVLADGSAQDMILALTQIGAVWNPSKRSHLLNLGLSSGDVDVQAQALEMLRWCDDADRSTFQANALNWVTGKLAAGAEERDGLAAVKVIPSIEDSKRTEIVVLALNNSHEKVRAAGAVMIDHVEENQRTCLIIGCLNSTTPDVQANAMRCAESIWRLEIPELVERGFHHRNKDVQTIAIRLLPRIPEESRGRLLREAFMGSDQLLKKLVVRGAKKELIGNLPQYLPLISECGLSEELVSATMYDGGSFSRDTFSRSNFKKTGSTTTLIGGELLRSIIIRHIDPGSFLVWQKAFEAADEWKSAGFDYVPVEPIHSYHLTNAGRVDVYSGVLDCSAAEWDSKTTLYKGRLAEQRLLIREVLLRLGINHGHSTILGNYCYRFHRTPEGQVDFTRPPLQFIIDFDRAVMPTE